MEINHFFYCSYFTYLISLAWITFKIDPAYLVDSGMTLEFFIAALFQRPCAHVEQIQVRQGALCYVRRYQEDLR